MIAKKTKRNANDFHYKIEDKLGPGLNVYCALSRN